MRHLCIATMTNDDIQYSCRCNDKSLQLRDCFPISHSGFSAVVCVCDAVAGDL